MNRLPAQVSSTKKARDFTEAFGSTSSFAANLTEENGMLFKLKEMEYLKKIANKSSEITVFGNGGMVKQLKAIFPVN